MKRQRPVSVYWTDIHAYSDNALHSPTQMYTEGTLVRSNQTYIVLADPETITISQVRNHPRRKPRFYCIPRALISSIEPI